MVLFRNPESTQALYALILICGGFAVSFFPLRSQVVSGWLNRRFDAESASVYLFLFGKILGFVSLGLLPAVLFYLRFGDTGPGFTALHRLGGQELLIFFLLMSLIIILAYRAAQKEDIYKRIPQMSVSQWGPQMLAVSVFGWGIYLLGYEYIFRQLFLFTWVDAFGPVPAIIANGILYAVFHIPNGKKETLGSIPFGVVLCLITLYTGSFLGAWILHLTLSLSTTLFSIHHNPDMSFNLIKK
jgi:membrane protease YdiL (CAAX protease family)